MSHAPWARGGGGVRWTAGPLLSVNVLCCAARFWDFERGENYVLGSSTGSEVITCISYNSRTSQLPMTILLTYDE